jgi:ribosomal protein L25 (general stress protein Ctc)
MLKLGKDRGTPFRIQCKRYAKRLDMTLTIQSHTSEVLTKEVQRNAFTPSALKIDTKALVLPIGNTFVN